MLRTAIKFGIAVDVINSRYMMGYQGGNLLAGLNVTLVVVASIVLQNKEQPT